MTRPTSLSLRARLLLLLVFLGGLFVVVTLSWVWWFAPRTTVFADLELQRLRREFVRLPPQQRTAWLQAHSGLEAFFEDERGKRTYLARSQHPLGYRVWLSQLSVALPGGAGLVVLQQQAPRGIALLFDASSLGRLLLFVTLLAAAVAAAVLYAERLLSQAVGSILSALESSLEARERVRHCPALQDDPDLQPVVAAFEHTAERLLATQRELQLTLQRLEALQQHKADVLAAVTHDLRTPLTVLLAQTDSSVVKAETERLLQRVERVLEWSRLRAGPLAPQWQEFELQEALEDALHRTGRLGSVQVRGVQDGVLVFSDFHWLSRVLQSFCASLTEVEFVYSPAAVGVRLPLPRWVDADHLSREECQGVLDALQVKAEWGQLCCTFWVARL